MQLEIFTLEVWDGSQASRSERRSISGNTTDLFVGAVPGTSWFVETVHTPDASEPGGWRGVTRAEPTQLEPKQRWLKDADDGVGSQRDERCCLCCRIKGNLGGKNGHVQ